MSHDSRPVGCFERIKAKFRREKSPARTVQAGPASGYATCNSISAQSHTERQSFSPTLPTDDQPSASTHPNDANAATAPHASDASDRAASPYSLRERLWNDAYDQARIEDSETVEGYEKILSAQLRQEEADLLDSSHPNSTDKTTPGNEIEQDVEKRQKQMRQLVQNGSQRINKETDTKQSIQSGIKVAMVLKEVVDKAVQASHEAALAWVGVCIGLQILMNPLTEASSNRQGIKYVVSRMNWYWELSSLLLDENIEPDQQGSRGKLEQEVAQLYAQLLLYQMKSVCSYYRRRFLGFLRDLVKLDDWDGKLNDIETAEEAVRQDSEKYNTQDIRKQLRKIAETAKSQNAKLDNISSAIHKQTKQQMAIHETDEDRKCLKDLYVTDPQHHKETIEELKGGLLEGSYNWVLENSDFKMWRDDPQSRLLWVKADPGKGKTMLLCGIINKLQKLNTARHPVYFFCQATDSRINSATAVLRGLLYMLVNQQRSLISHVREEYDRKGEKLFMDGNAWVAMKEIFTKILNDTELEKTYLIIDALDECTTDRDKLLEFIAQHSSVSRVKWIISSRNWPNIEERLQQAGHKVKLSLELNAESVSAAVSTFITHKVSQLAQDQNYDKKTRDAVLEHLTSNANDTFLWVALVCEELKPISVWDVQEKLNDFPPGLDALYKQMIQQISKQPDAKVCKQILALVALMYRPITIKELTSLVSGLQDRRLQHVVKYPGALHKIVSSCGSFLTLREETVYFVHQSANDFLLRQSKGTSKGAFDEIFPSGTSDVHHAIFSASLQIMSSTLRRDMYNLKKRGYPLGHPAEKINKPDPDPLAASRYACSYWVDHLTDSHHNTSQDHTVALQDGGPVDTFLRQKYLYWLESLSLCKAISKGVNSIAKLEMLVQKMPNAVELSHLVKDACRFIMSHKVTIEHSPLQAYASALLFSPAGSLVRKHFEKEEPKWVTIRPYVGDAWSACLQTLEGHSDWVRSVVFSHDSTRLASASDDNTVKIWDASSGACLQTLKIGKSLRKISFDTTGSYLHTEIGAIAITTSLVSQIVDDTRPQYQGAGVSTDGAWITYKGEHVLWLPSEYRPSCSIVSEKSVSIGVGSGKVWICSFLP